MRHIGFLVEDGFQVVGLAAVSAFEFANATLERSAYALTLMSRTGGSVASSLGGAVTTQPLGAFPDTLVVLGELVPTPTPERLRAYIAEVGAQSRRVAGICTGAFRLAEAGLLDGRAATTHWAHARALQERYPSTRVDDDRIFIRDGNVWTSAGMSAGIDLALALIEDDHEAALARARPKRTPCAMMRSIS
jgi:transcriptional regulator GlxA family with amidase domain